MKHPIGWFKSLLGRENSATEVLSIRSSDAKVWETLKFSESMTLSNTHLSLPKEQFCIKLFVGKWCSSNLRTSERGTAETVPLVCLFARLRIHWKALKGMRRSDDGAIYVDVSNRIETPESWWSGKMQNSIKQPMASSNWRHWATDSIELTASSWQRRTDRLPLGRKDIRKIGSI